MAQLFVEGFSHYGTGAAAAAAMLEGTWAELGGYPGSPSWDTSGEGYWLFKDAATQTANRVVLPASVTDLIVSLSYGVDALPSKNHVLNIVQFRDVNNYVMGRITCDSTGIISLLNGDGTLLSATAGPVIAASTRYHLEMEYTTAGHFELRVDEVAVIAASGLTFGFTPSLVFINNDTAQLALNFQDVAAGVQPLTWVKDLIVRDKTGTVNNGFAGDRKVATLFPNADTSVAGWAPQPRKTIGTGYLDCSAAANACVTAAATTSLDLGVADFTLETFWRPHVLPVGGNIAVLMGKWNETGNQRSYQLYWDSATNEIKFRISTDGTAATVNNILAYPWTPDKDTKYNIALVRSAGELLLFVDGAQLGLPIADANTYFAGTSLFSINSQFDSGVVANTGTTGWYDELRVTPGVARYTAPYAVTTVAFGRNVGADPSFASVALLIGCDSSLSDESSFARALTARNGAVQATADDGTAGYQTIDQHSPRDDTFMEAALLPATDILTPTANFLNNETVTVGTKDGVAAAVYTFKTVLTPAAYEVLIGATDQDSINNLIAAINLGAGGGTLYGSGGVANFDVTASQLPSAQMLVTANTAGTVGNTIAATETAANAAWDTATLAGGVDIPGPSEFTFDRPPPGTTVVDSLTIVTRNYKSDAGTCTDTHAFVGPLGGSTAGAAAPLSTNPSYHSDIFEKDPDTAGSITPSTLNGGRVRLNRTA